jgi:hypothetical protein
VGDPVTFVVDPVVVVVPLPDFEWLLRELLPVDADAPLDADRDEVEEPVE